MRNLKVVYLCLLPVLTLSLGCDLSKGDAGQSAASSVANTPAAATAPNSPAAAASTEAALASAGSDKSLVILGAACSDPGLRTGPAGAGQPLPALSANQMDFFNAGLATFAEVDSVSGNMPTGSGAGLGPAFNGNSCGQCHAYPTIGGSSPLHNPQVALANLAGATNQVPAFITASGPVREVRFKYLTNADGSLTSTRDGGVHDLYTIAGRADAGNCALAQPDFVTAAKFGNLTFRIPTPTFGAGMIESISDSTILQNHAATSTLRQIWGITGHTNNSGNDGSITRFGWKAQNKSLAIFAGEAYNVEQGVTNELFPNERVTNEPACLLNAIPEDHTNYDSLSTTQGPSDVIRFTAFMRMLAPPTPAPATPSTTRGAAVFNAIGCNLCHTPALPVAPAAIYAQTEQNHAYLYSDLYVHHMGATLADDIVQGSAGPDEFRSAPLWGLGQRTFFLHDGRTNDLVQAILLHASAATGQYPASEANLSIQHFLNQSPASQQDLLNFLRSL